MLAVFARHPVAANLLMAMMMISGLWGLSQLNTQFFPSFDIDFVSVRVTWPGASAEDLETLVTDPLERELKGIDNVKELASLSVDGQTLITLEFRENTDMGPALDEVKERVDLVTNLPDGADNPKISRIINHELVASLLVSGPDDQRGLRALVNQFERELLEQGISHIRIFGLPEEEIAIQISPGTLRELGLTLEDVSRRISAASRDMPVGIIGRGESALQLRFKDQRRREYAFADLPLIVAGKSQGQVKQGRFIRAKSGTLNSNMWLSIAKLSGLSTLSDSSRRICTRSPGSLAKLTLSKVVANTGVEVTIPASTVAISAVTAAPKRNVQRVLNEF